MTKVICSSLICVVLFSGCAQPKHKFGVQDVAKYGKEITIVTKLTVKSLCKNSSQNDLKELQNYVSLAREFVSLQQGENTALFEQLNTILENTIKNQKTEDIVKFVLVYVERYVNSLDVRLSDNQQAVKSIVLSALEGADKAIDELLAIFER